MNGFRSISCWRFLWFFLRFWKINFFRKPYHFIESNVTQENSVATKWGTRTKTPYHFHNQLPIGMSNVRRRAKTYKQKVNVRTSSEPTPSTSAHGTAQHTYRQHSALSTWFDSINNNTIITDSIQLNCATATVKFMWKYHNNNDRYDWAGHMPSTLSEWYFDWIELNNSELQRIS